MAEEYEEHKGGGYLRGLLTGVLVGAAAALLLAPKRGEEMRQDLSEGAGRWREKAEDLKGKAEDLSGRVSETAHDLKERGQHLIDNARERGAAVVDHAKGEVEEFSAQAADEVAAVKDDINEKAHDVVESA